MSVSLNIFFLYEDREDIKNFGKNLLEDWGLWKKSYPFSVEDNTPFVYYAFLNHIELIPNTTQKDSLELPESLIIPPGKYNFYGNTYELQKEGLYRFVYPPKENKQRIVYDRNLTALLSSLSWIVSHGNSDNSKSNDELTRKAMKSKLFLTCGKISSWAHYILNTQGINSRVVAGLTLDEWNSYDNGHTLIEVYRKEYNKWVVYDLDQNAYFLHNGEPLSLIEFANYSASGNYEIRYISSDIRVDISNFLARDTNYDYAFVAERKVNSLKLWYKRVMQVPMIRDGSYYYFFDNTHRSRIESYSSSYRYMDEEQFMEKFY